jgi:predicted AAA+ superfamily ATPase
MTDYVISGVQFINIRMNTSNPYLIRTTLPEIKKHTLQQELKKERERVLLLAQDMYGLMMTIEKVNQDDWMDYLTLKMEDFKIRYESLRDDGK